MAESKCVICGEKVYPDSPSQVLRTGRGDKACKGAYWMVVSKVTGNAVGSFFQERGGQSAAVRARAYAAKSPNWTAKRIASHGHQVK